MFFDPRPPDYLMLHCLRSGGQRARTSVAALSDIEQLLTSDVIDELHRPAFALDLARLHGTYVHNGLPIDESQARPVIPIINLKDPAPFRFEPALMTPVGSLAAEALHHVETAATVTAAEGTLGEGGLLLVDNRRAAHSRSSFPTHFDGRDRWLRRVMVGIDSPDPGDVALRRHEMELIHPWIRTGARVRRVPYSSTSRS
jgi:hypothetical protein